MCHLQLHHPTSDFTTWRPRVDYPCSHTAKREQCQRAISLCNQFKDGAPNGNLGKHRSTQCYWIILCELFVKLELTFRWWRCEENLECHCIVLDTVSALDNSNRRRPNSNPDTRARIYERKFASRRRRYESRRRINLIDFVRKLGSPLICVEVGYCRWPTGLLKRVFSPSA